MFGLLRGLAPTALLLAGCVAPTSEPTSATAARAVTSDGGLDGSLGCGPIGYSPGCCAGPRTLVYCVDDQLQVEQCGPQASCGWSVNFRIYACGASSAPDPTGKMPRDCPVGVDAGIDVGAPPPIDAGSQGDQALLDSAAGCGSLTYVGCCAGDELRFCSGGSVLTLRCPAGTCGWNSSGAFYDCNAAGAVSPSHPRACAAASDGAAPQSDGAVDTSGAVDAQPDLPADAGVLRDQQPAYDGFVVEEDGPPPLHEAGASDAAPGDVSGIDAVGLDGSEADGGGFRVGSGGCGCDLSSDRPPTGGVAWLAALGLLVLGVRRR